MFFKIECPKCGKVLKVGEQHLNRKANCPYCKHGFVVPGPKEEQAPPQEEQPFEGIDTGDPVAERRAKSKPQPAKGAAVSVLQTGVGSDVSLLVSGAIAIALSVVFCGLMFPLKGTYLGDLFLDRGWVPFALIFLTSWSAAILVLKARKMARQRQAMLLDLLPTDISADITPDSVEAFLSHISTQPVRPQDSYLVNRVVRGLEHFRVRNSASEVASILSSQGEIDATTVASSYTMTKVFIWAIPILGFIGTVIGISAAVGGFSGSLDDTNDVAKLKESLNGVTGGLATAFDTTLVALVMSLLVKFPTSSLQKQEEGFLNGIDEYCNENLLKRLDDGRGGLEGGMTSDAALEAWTRRMEAMGTKHSQQVVEAWDKINQGIIDGEAQRVARVKEVDQVMMQAGESMRESAESLNKGIAQLNAGLKGLNQVLGSLGQQKVSIEVPERRRSWAFWRSNGS